MEMVSRETNATKIDLPMSRQDIADYLGLTVKPCRVCWAALRRPMSSRGRLLAMWWCGIVRSLSALIGSQTRLDRRSAECGPRPLHSIATDPVPFNIRCAPIATFHFASSGRVLEDGRLGLQKSSFSCQFCRTWAPFPTQAMRLLMGDMSRANPLRAAKLRGDRRSANRVARPPSSETQSGVSSVLTNK